MKYAVKSVESHLRWSGLLAVALLAACSGDGDAPAAPGGSAGAELATGAMLRLQSACDGSVLTVQGGDAQADAAVVLAEDVEVLGQRWILQRPEGGSPGSYVLRAAGADSLALGSAAALQTGSGPTVQWRAQAVVGSDAVELRPLADTTARLGAKGSSPATVSAAQTGCQTHWRVQAAPLAAGAELAAIDSYTWRPIAVGGGGFIMSQDIDRSGLVRVIRTDTYGAYRWSGKRWVQLINDRSLPAEDVAAEVSAEGVTELVLAPSQPRRLYMQFRGGIYRSDNLGQRWRRSAFASVYMGPNDDYRQWGPRLAVDPFNADIVLAGTQRNGLWRSTDGAASWQPVTSLPPGLDDRPDVDGEQGPGVLVWFDRSSRGAGGNTPNALAVSHGRGFYRSTDGGAGWQALPGGGPKKASHGGFADDGTFYAAGPEGVWRLRAGVWAEVSPRSSDWVSVAVDPRNGNRLFAFDGGGGVYRSTDAGSTWSNLPRDVVAGPEDVPWLAWIDNSYFTTSQVIFDPSRPGRLWVSGGAGVYRADTSDTASSLTWVTQSRGIEQLVANDVVAPPGGKPVLAGWDFGLRVAESLTQYPATHGPFRRFNSVWQVDYSPGNPQFMVANTSDHRFCCSEDGGAVQAGYSEDGGRSWTVFASLPRPPGTSADDPWAFAFGSIAVAADNVDNIVWLPTSNRAPQYTLDRGRTWNRIQLPGEPATDPGSHFAYFLNRKNLAADRVLAGTFYYMHSGTSDGSLKGVWRSRDGGRSWQRRFDQNLAPFDVFNAQLKAVPGQAGHLFFSAGALDGIDSPMRRSTDGGQSWTDVTGLARVSAFGFGKAAPGTAYPAVYAAGKFNGQYGIWRSVDNAVSWEEVGRWPGGSLDMVTAIDGDKDVFGRVYMGLKGSGWVVGEPRR